MAATRNQGPLGLNRQCDGTGDGTLCRARSPAQGPAGLMLGTWRAARQGTPYIAPTPFQLIGEFQRRIANARDIAELARIAADVAEVRDYYESQGLISRPPGGDDAVRDTVKGVIGDQLGAMQRILFNTGWGLAHEDLGAGIVEGAETALWEVIKQIVEDRCGAFWKELASAIVKGRIKHAMKLAEAAAKELSDSFSDRDGLMRNTLRVMRRNGLVIDKRVEYRLRKLMDGAFDRWAGNIAAIEKFFTSAPIMVAAKVFFTPSTVPDDAGELYLGFNGLRRRLARRFRELAPLPDVGTAVSGLPSHGRNRGPEGPVLRGVP